MHLHFIVSVSPQGRQSLPPPHKVLKFKWAAPGLMASVKHLLDAMQLESVVLLQYFCNRPCYSSCWVEKSTLDG